MIAQTRAGETFQYHYDGLGSTRGLSDTSGALTDTWDYQAFGEILERTGDTDNAYLFTGEQFDQGLDQYYLRARYYDQSVGRFTQMDTYQGRMGEPVTLHKYIYGHNDVPNGIDPSGNMFISGILGTGFHNAAQGGRAVGLRVTMKKLGKELACVMVEDILISEIASIASGVYIFSDEQYGGKAYTGKTVNHKKRRMQHGDRVKDMMVKIEFHVEDILDLFNMKDEKRAFNNGLRALEQSVMDYLDDLDVDKSNKFKSVADKPKSFNSQKIRRILNKGIDLCPK